MVFNTYFPTSSIILLSAAVFAIVLIYWIYIRRINRVTSYACASVHPDADSPDAGQTGQTPPPASVVIYAQDEAEELASLLPRVLDQEYDPGFEVIVVNEGESECTSDIVDRLRISHPNLYLTFTPDGARSLSRKKLALMLGIKAARYPVVVNTMASARINSRRWLADMMQPFADSSTEVVLGFAIPDPDDDRQMGKRVRAFDQCASAVTWLTSAIGGKPYRGTGYNLAYTRDIFFRNKGFSRSLNKQNGDDDIFIHEIATPENTAVVMTPESRVGCRYYNARKAHAEQMRSREFTGRFIPKTSRRLMALGEWLIWAMIILCACASIVAYPGIIPAIVGIVLTVGTLVWVALTWRRAMRTMGSRSLLFTVPWFTMTRPLRNIRLFLKSRLTSHHEYTWKV